MRPHTMQQSDKRGGKGKPFAACSLTRQTPACDIKAMSGHEVALVRFPTFCRIKCHVARLPHNQAGAQIVPRGTAGESENAHAE
jgi:hypothetical protein